MYLFKSFKVQAIGSIVDCNFMYYLTFSFGSRLGVLLECVICISMRKEFAVIRGDNIICCGHWQVFIRCYEEYMYSFVLLSSFVHIHILL